MTVLPQPDNNDPRTFLHDRIAVEIAEHSFDRLGRCSCGGVLDSYGDRHHSKIEMAQHVSDAVMGHVAPALAAARKEGAEWMREEAAVAAKAHARAIFFDPKYGSDPEWVWLNLRGGGEHVIRALTPPTEKSE